MVVLRNANSRPFQLFFEMMFFFFANIKRHYPEAQTVFSSL